MKIHLVTFITDSKFGKENYYAKSVRKLFDSAKKFGVEHFHLYKPEILPVSEYILDYMKNTSEEGFGYYSWKPIVILDVIQKISEGDVVIYHDAGRQEYNYEFRKDFRPLVKNIIENFNGVGIPVGPFSHRQYCKRDCFVHMKCNEERYWNLTQVSANWSIWQKNNISLQFLTEWKNYCFDPRGIITTHATTGPLSDFEDFIEHRHDQAILTNLANRYAFEGNAIGLLPARGWEKDINNFIHEEPAPRVIYEDCPLIKIPHTTLSQNKIPLVLDVFYKNDKLTILTSGAVDQIEMVDTDTAPIRGNKIEDPHKNVYVFEFNIAYQENVTLKLKPYNNVFGESDSIVNVEIKNNYYKNYDNNHIISVICNGNVNSIYSIKTFVKYHINLGIDRIILHYREGNNIKEIYDELRDYIDKEQLIIVDWDGVVPFYQDIRNDGCMVGLGEVAHMNHTLYVYRETEYITWINLDQLLVIPHEKELNEHLQDLKNEYECGNSGGFSVRLIDFSKPDSTKKYYESTHVIPNISPLHHCVYFTKNVSILSSHTVTLGAPLYYGVDDEKLVVNHYPFLDNNRNLPTEIINVVDNLNYNLLIGP